MLQSTIFTVYKMGSLCNRVHLAFEQIAKRCGMTVHQLAEMKILAILAAPVCITYVLSFFLQIVNVMVVGHVGAEALAAAALGNMYANASGNSIVFGAASACDTLQSQAYGAKNYKRVGAISQRGMAILLVLCIPVSLVWYNVNLVLTHLGQDPATADLAVHYVRLLILGLPAAALYEVLKKHLQSLGLMVPPMLISTAAIILNGILGYIFVFHTSLSFYGAPVATAVSQWCMLFTMLLYFRNHRATNAVLRRFKLLGPPTLSPETEKPESAHIEASLAADLADEVDMSVIAMDPTEAQGTVNEPAQPAAPAGEQAEQPTPEENLDPDHLLELTWTGFSSKEAFSGWREFIGLGVPSAAMLLVEWGSFEVAALISGLVSTYALAAHTIIATTASLSFMPILGIGVAAGIRVGQKMGERRPKDAVLTYRVVIIISLLYVIVNACFIASIKNVWGYLFTDDPVVIDLLSRWLILLALYTVFDAFQCVCSGVVRGVGRPSLAAAANVVAYMAVGLPCSYFFAIHLGFGLPGVWTGFVLAVFMAFVVLAMALNCVNWEKESIKAYERAIQGHDPNVKPTSNTSSDSSKDDTFQAHLDALVAGSAGMSASGGLAETAVLEASHMRRP